MSTRRSKKKLPKQVEALTHDEAKRRNLPTAEYQSIMDSDDLSPVQVAYERRNRDVDPQLVWRGKDQQDWSDLVVQAPPLFIQEKVHPKVLIDDLMRRTKESSGGADDEGQFDLFADFNGISEEAKKTEFYQHDANWTNRMILGDSLQVMASLAEREGLRGKVQCIYFDPPYGIRFNSNFQWSTTTKDVKDGAVDHITREPEQVRAFRDTWRDGIHSYLSYIRDRLSVARDLLTESGSLFVQIGTENIEFVAAVLDEVFGAHNKIELISFRKKTMPLGGQLLEGNCDYLLWYAKDREQAKYRPLYQFSVVEGDTHWNYVELPSGHRRKMSSDEIASHRLLPEGAEVYQLIGLYPAGAFATGIYEFEFNGTTFKLPPGKSWKSPREGMNRLAMANRLQPYAGGSTLRYVLKHSDYPVTPLSNVWQDTSAPSQKQYVVQTSNRVIQRCVLMTTDPGDLVLDPTCGSGTTAFVAEKWGRRWITIDTSRVALALTRARIMGSRYSYYLLSDSREGQRKLAEITRSGFSDSPTRGDIRHGFVYERAPHVTLKSIANDAEIDVIWEKFGARSAPLLRELNSILGQQWDEWCVPLEADKDWPSTAKSIHEEWSGLRRRRQEEIDASIAAKTEAEYLYDSPYIESGKVRVAGPFTVESLSPHRVPGVDEDDELIDSIADGKIGYRPAQDFPSMILENLKMSGVQQAHKEDKIEFTSLTPWPGDMIAAEGRYVDGDGTEKRAGIMIGPEFGTVSRPDLVKAAKEAGEAGFDVVIACAFSYAAQASEISQLGRISILKARMNADLHMAEDLKSTGKGNLFVIFGEPDIDILDAEDGQIQVKINGVDVFDPRTGEVRSDDVDGIACWFIDTEYNEESFFVRHAYFLGANDPYKSLKSTLKAEINKEAWETLHSDTSRPFDKPRSGRIAVKVINHLGDEVMKVFRVE
ncbi:MAG: site-specific DNA-methyltransferase [Acidobacteria bacterium]|nr:site-specific DNA-methyltransferase [Acidobacteriota bacterium]